MRFAAAAFVLLGTICAQESPKTEPAKTEPEPAPVLKNAGKPMRLPFQCTDEDMQWAGMSCSEEQPCPIYLEISAMEAVGNRIVAAGNIHTESLTMYSVLLTSEDGGETWREPYERLRGTGFDHVQFIDFQNGWISGETLVPVSHDPFLVITSDGGKSWRLRPIFGEGSGGAIKEFWFQSSLDGTMVIDRMSSSDSSRYELYESPNGGETWMIRRTSDKPIAIRHTAPEAAASGWRIRADARTKSFVIERQVGERWSTAASFLVEIGSCKPAPRVLAPPETVEPAAPAPTSPPSVKPGAERGQAALSTTWGPDGGEGLD
jgi:photosystem II stability/assembly factor-like uncharacterized protein